MRRLILAILFAGAVSAQEGTSLGETIVQRWMQGVPVDQLVQQVEQAERFEMDPDLLGELEAVGLPPALLAAIRKRLEAAPSTEAVAAHGRPLVIILKDTAASSEPASAPAPDEAKDDSPTTDGETASDGPSSSHPAETSTGEQTENPLPPPLQLRMTASLPDEVLASANLPPETEAEDLAVFIADLESTHVPDQWRSHSPLGRDFVSMPRHRMLAFHEGAVRQGGAKAEAEPSQRKQRRSLFRPGPAGATLVLDLPESVEATLEDDAPFHLMFGVALKVEGRYYRVASTELRDFDPDSDGQVVAMFRNSRSSRRPPTVALATEERATLSIPGAPSK